MARFNRKLPSVNATSSADIAFILLLFFLLTGSLNPDLGIFRHLLPDTSEARLKKRKNIEQRDFLVFTLTDKNELLMDGKPVWLPELRNTAKTFISNPDNLENLPRKETLDFEGVGKVEIAPNAVISLEMSRKTDYETYLKVFGELSAAYSELRDEFSQVHFGRNYERLTAEQQSTVREIYPIRISERETDGKEAER